MRFCRSAMMPPTRGSATFAIKRVEQDEGDDEPNELRSKRLRIEGRECTLMPARHFGMGSGCHRGTDGYFLEREEQQQRDQQREDAERFGHGEPEDQVAELALRGRRIAQGGGQIVAEDRADADAGAAHADAGNAGTDVFCCDWIHDELLCLIVAGLQWPGWIASLR